MVGHGNWVGNEVMSIFYFCIKISRLECDSFNSRNIMHYNVYCMAMCVFQYLQTYNTIINKIAHNRENVDNIFRIFY